MFGLTHILYLVISFAISGAIIALGRIFIKTEEAHNRVVKFLAIITVLIHISPMWVDFLATGSAEVSSVILFPIHPCNVCMWLLVAASFMKREGALYRLISEFACLGGTVCGIIGLVFNENFGNNPTLADWDIFKGLLSHSTMILGALYLATSGLVKIRLHNLVSVTWGLIFFVVDGALINGIYSLFKLDPCNSMYLQEPPFDNMPWLTTPLIGVAAIFVAFSFTVLFEKLALKKEWKEIFTLSNLLGAFKNEPETAEAPAEAPTEA